MEIQKQVPPPVEIKVSKQEELQAQESAKPVDRQYEKLSIADVFEAKQALTAERNLKPSGANETKKSETPANQVSLKSNTTASFSEQQNSKTSQAFTPTKNTNILSELSRTKEDVTDIGPDEGA